MLQSHHPSHQDSSLLIIPSPAPTPGTYPRNLLRRSPHSLKVHYRLRADTLRYLHATLTFGRYQPFRTAPCLTNHIPNSPPNLANGQTRTMKIIAKNSNPLTQTQPRNKRRNTSDDKTHLPRDAVEQGEPKKPCHCVMKTQD